jgi:hypothetical protein
MPVGPFYDLTARLKLRLLKGTSEAKDIDAGFHALGEDLDAALALSNLRQVTHAASVEAQSGELVLAIGGGMTVTLPAATLNRIVGVYATATVTVKQHAADKIYGDFVSAASTITLLADQHVILQSDGTNWQIVAGEPQRTSTYNGLKKYTKAEAEAGVLASPTRPAFVSTNAGPTEPLFVEGHSVGPCFLVWPGQKWTSLFAIEASTLLL